MKYHKRLLYHIIGATAAIGKCIAKEEDQSHLPLGLSGLNYLHSTNGEERGSMNRNRNLRSKPERVLKGITQKTSSSTSSRFDSTPNYTRMRKNDQIETDPIGCFEDQSTVDYIEFQDSLDIIEDCGEHCSTDFFGLVGATCKCFLETPVKRISISSCRDVGMDVYYKSTWSDQCNQDITRNLRDQLVQENNADLGYDIVRNIYLPSPFEFYNNGCGTNIYELNTDVSGSDRSMTTVSNVLSEYAMEKRSHISQSIKTSAETSFKTLFSKKSIKVSASADYEMNNAFQSSGASETGSKRFSSFGVHKLSTIEIENFDNSNHFATFSDKFIDALRHYITSGYAKDFAKKIFDYFGMVVVEHGVVGGFVQISATSKSSDLSQYFSSENEMKKCYETAVSGSGKFGPVSGSFSAEASGCSGEALSLMESAQEQFSFEASETNYVGGVIEDGKFTATPETAKLLTNADMYDDGDGMRLRLITDFLNPKKINPLEIKRHLLTEAQFEEARMYLQDHALEILEDIGDELDDCSSCDGVPYLDGTDDFTCDCYKPSIVADLQPPVSDYKVWLDGESWNGNTWLDKSSNKFHPGIHGTINKAIEEDKNMAYVYGGTSSGVTIRSGWPSGSEYTLFHVTKYDNASKQRIWTGTTGNWLSGHWNGVKGKFFHEGWVANYGRVGDVLDWSIFTDRVNSVGTNVRIDGLDFTANLTPNYIPDGIGINPDNNRNERSDWAAALVLIYDRFLDDNEVVSVEDWIKAEYLYGDI